MSFLVDTGLLIRYLRGNKDAVQLLRALGKGDRLCISTITRLEVQAGAHPDEVYATRKLLSRLLHLVVDERIADRAGTLLYQGKGQRSISVPDAIIAATGIVHSVTLVTFNAQDFKGIAALSLHPLSR